MQIHEVCNQRCKKVVKGERQKTIVRVRTTPYVQVHLIRYGKRMYINHNMDLVMVHFKLGFRRMPAVPMLQNPFVEQALHRALFFPVCDKHPKIQCTKHLRIGDSQRAMAFLFRSESYTSQAFPDSLATSWKTETSLDSPESALFLVAAVRSPHFPA